MSAEYKVINLSRSNKLSGVGGVGVVVGVGVARSFYPLSTLSLTTGPGRHRALFFRRFTLI